MSMHKTEDRGASKGLLTALVLLWLSGVGLRITVLAVPPVIPLIHRELRLSQAGVGVLTALPSLLFAAAAVPGSLFISRFGPVQTLVTGLILTAIASALRGAAPDALLLYGTTFLMGVGISIMQPALPRIVRDWLPDRIWHSSLRERVAAWRASSRVADRPFHPSPARRKMAFKPGDMVPSGPHHSIISCSTCAALGWFDTREYFGARSLVAGLEEPAHLAAWIYFGRC